MGRQAYLVVKHYYGEGIEPLAVWREEQDAREHAAALKAAWDGPSYDVWTIQFEWRVEDPPPRATGRIVSVFPPSE